MADLNSRPRSTPTGEQLEEFLFAIPDHIAPRQAHSTVPSYFTIDAGMKSLILYLQFTYRDFKLTDYDTLHLSKCLTTPTLDLSWLLVESIVLDNS